MSEPFESIVERKIREAQERGEFDDLPGAGKPLQLGDPYDEDWWLASMLRREGVDRESALPSALALRKEAHALPESLLAVRTEAAVREIVEDFNRRVRVDRLRPAVGPLPPVLARTLDVEEMVAAWRTATGRGRSTPGAE